MYHTQSTAFGPTVGLRQAGSAVTVDVYGPGWRVVQILSNHVIVRFSDLGAGAHTCESSCKSALSITASQHDTVKQWLNHSDRVTLWGGAVVPALNGGLHLTTCSCTARVGCNVLR